MLAAETPQEQFQLIGAGRRNLLINGGMDVWQRATSHTTASGYRSVDRWSFNTYTGGAFTVSKEVDSVHGNYLKWNRTAQDTSNSNAGNAIQQAIENAQYVIGDQYVTLSFWLKDEAGLGSGFVRLRQAASPYSRVTADNQDETWYSSSTEWEYHTFTFKIKSAADISMSNVQLLIRMDNGTAQGGVSIAKVQLELGKVATPFEHRSYGEELAACQRYYERFNGQSEWLMAHGYNADIYATIDWKVPKRIDGGVVTYSNSDFSNIFSAYRNTGSSAAIDGVMTGVVTAKSAIKGVSLSIDLSSGSYTPYGTSVMWRVDNGHWIAYDAEL